MRWEAIAEVGHAERFNTLLDCPPDQRGLDWLQTALQAAVAVEFATIPPYLCALWSIQDDRHPAAASIRNVVQEEMLHMSLACNMLAAVGGTPQISSVSVAPVYWEHLPAGIHPDLVVKLGGFTDAALAGFIEIESPDPLTRDGGAGDATHRSIGDFYTAVADSLADLRPAITIDHQVAGPLAHMTIPTVESALTAIALIKDQGEGSRSPIVAHTDELAHYYRFLELKQRQQISHLDDSGAPVFVGPLWEEPSTWPVASVPDGGYREPDVPPDVWRQLDQFDRTFTKLLDLLQLAWELGQETPFVRAIEVMFELTTRGRSLMQIERPDGNGNYCPNFRRVG
jgi:hypothetical protein